MTSYRCVCPQCTAYITSGESRRWESEEDFQEWWAKECETFLKTHTCGEYDGDNVENQREFDRYTAKE